MAKDKQMKHSLKSDRPNYGENIFYFSGKYLHGDHVVRGWYSESIDHNYQYGKEPKDLKAGTYSIML